MLNKINKKKTGGARGLSYFSTNGRLLNNRRYIVTDK